MYAELHCLSNFTFLRGASHPQELVQRAAQLGYTALAITDECSVAGVVRAYSEIKKHSLALKLIIGSEFRLGDGLRCVLLAMNRKGYGQLSRLISHARRSAPKGEYHLVREDFFQQADTLEALAWKKPRSANRSPHKVEAPLATDQMNESPPLSAVLTDCLALWIPGEQPDVQQGEWLRAAFPDRAWMAVELLTSGQDRNRLGKLQQLSQRISLPMVASGDVHMHVRQRRALQDTVTAIRLGVPLMQAGFHLYPNGERHLRSLKRLQSLYPQSLLQETVRIADLCTFSLGELRYEYPEEIVPKGETLQSHLRNLTFEGMRKHWPQGAPESIQATICKELSLIEELKYEAFFITVHDAVQFATKERILCQGRGSAANSVVCYCLGITSVDPKDGNLLFERFVSRERNEPPDIDVDFEHDRREEVIQYLYDKYGRHRAAIAATLITYHSRSALRDVGKALGFDLLQVDRLARSMQWWDAGGPSEERIREAGFEPSNPRIQLLIGLVNQLSHAPRHLSQHVGGFVISSGPLCELVPVENASMPNRTVIQWNKDDLEDLGLLKVDVLALGMLSVLRRSFQLIDDFHGQRYTLANIPQDDESVYDMICAADTVGVFQIESRAQMSMLPRLRPRKYYDLVIEVAIVRPGPIQGDMVHPYLRRRTEQEPVTYPNEKVKEVLERTLGVPIFQEQVMQLAVVAAGFTPGEADQLRRAMAAWNKKGDLERFQQKLIEGMQFRNYDKGFIERIVNQIHGFGEYGFPESHAASFALLVYVSSWIKHHHPGIFLTALLNSQPMGFYQPSQLVQDARRHGVEVRDVDVMYSDWDSTLEKASDGQPAVRLGMRLIKGMSESAANAITQARKDNAFSNAQSLAERARLDRRALNALAAAGALQNLSGNRHHAVWAVSGVEQPTPLFRDTHISEEKPLIRIPGEGQNIAADYRSIGLTLGRHPLALLRDQLAGHGVMTAHQLRTQKSGMKVQTAGIVVTRQRPGGGNVCFVTLEDETGSINIIVWQTVGEQHRAALVRSRLMQVCGTLQHENNVMHVIADRLLDRTRLLGGLMTESRDFH